MSTFAATTPPDWLLAFWKEIDDKTFGRGFDCVAEDATCRLGVAEWTGRETIRANLRASSIPGSPRITMCSNTGTAARSRYFAASSP